MNREERERLGPEGVAKVRAGGKRKGPRPTPDLYVERLRDYWGLWLGRPTGPADYGFVATVAPEELED